MYEKNKFIPSDIKDYIHDTECQSLLYDIDLLPEQIMSIPNRNQRIVNWRRMCVVCRLLKKIKNKESEEE